MASGTFRGWLRTITRSRVIDWRRRIQGKDQAKGGSTAQSFFLDQPFDDAFSTGDSDDEQQLVQQMYLRALSVIRKHFQEKTWKAFWRVVVDGMTPKEVGRQLLNQFPIPGPSGHPNRQEPCAGTEQ